MEPIRKRFLALILLGASVLLFLITVVGGTLRRAAIRQMNTGGVAGFAVMGLAIELLQLCALGLFFSILLAALSATIWPRLGCITIVVEVTLATIVFLL
ncbi:MAG: hypothetical protein L0Y72_21295 [Gemmataceae bacterium]|nr:hypothetical protein [Gemmataceae bacterium]MCI0741579.1 hypothetical protein [Gemmataceae bacterium]